MRPSCPPGKNDLAHYVAWMNQEVKKYPITVHYHTEGTADMVKELNPAIVFRNPLQGEPWVPRCSSEQSIEAVSAALSE